MKLNLTQSLSPKNKKIYALNEFIETNDHRQSGTYTGSEVHKKVAMAVSEFKRDHPKSNLKTHVHYNINGSASVGAEPQKERDANFEESHKALHDHLHKTFGSNEKHNGDIHNEYSAKTSSASLHTKRDDNTYNSSRTHIE